MTSNVSFSSNNSNRPINSSISNGYVVTASNDNNAEDQLNRINLQALQNRDPYIVKIVDQAQRVCVYKFIAEKREWERKDLEGTLFVYERICKPYHGFVILSTVSRETFVQIIKPCMEFKHTPTYEAFLQYKVDVGDIYGIWFISKNDCPRVTECLIRLTEIAKDCQKADVNERSLSATAKRSNDILALLTNAYEKFDESKRKQETSNSETPANIPPVLLRLFSAQETSTSLNPINDEREEELKKTLGITGKAALSVTELEKQFLQPSPSQEVPKTIPNNNENLEKIVPSNSTKLTIQSKSSTTPTKLHITATNSKPVIGSDSVSINTKRLMTPADFQALRSSESTARVLPTLVDSSASTSCRVCHNPQSSSNNSFSKEHLRNLLVDMLRNDDELVSDLHNAYVEKQTNFHRIYS